MEEWTIVEVPLHGLDMYSHNQLNQKFILTLDPIDNATSFNGTCSLTGRRRATVYYDKLK